MGCAASNSVRSNQIKPNPDLKVENVYHFVRGRRNSLLGTGSYGRVYSGVAFADRQQAVAIKIIKKSKLTAHDKDRLYHEVDASMRLDHPGCVKMYGAYENEMEVSLVMEQLNGGELFERIEEVRDFGEAAAADTIRKIVDSVRYLHEQRKLCHRDLKPENLVFKTRAVDSDLKLIDFGLSAYIAGGPNQSENTQLKTQCGTAGYQAPEVLKGEEYGFAADMFSVGVIAYMLLTGSPPFYDSPRRPSIDVQIVKGLVSYDAAWCNHLSEQAIDFLQQLLHPNPSQRLTAAQVQSHPWMKKRLTQLAADEEVQPFDEEYHERFKETHAALKRKLQGKAWGVVAAISFAQAGAFGKTHVAAPVQDVWDSHSSCSSSDVSHPDSIPNE